MMPDEDRLVVHSGAVEIAQSAQRRNTTHRGDTGGSSRPSHCATIGGADVSSRQSEPKRRRADRVVDRATTSPETAESRPTLAVGPSSDGTFISTAIDTALDRGNEYCSLPLCPCTGYEPPGHNPKCSDCGHPRSFHQSDGCWGFGCPIACPSFRSPLPTMDCHLCEHPRGRHRRSESS